MNQLTKLKSYQTIILMICLAIIIVFIFSLFLSREYAKVASRDVEEITKSKMSHIYENTTNVLEHLKIYGLNFNQEDTIHSWLLSNQVDPISDYSAYQSVVKLARLQPFITSVYLINTTTERVIDSSIGVKHFNHFNDQGMLELLNDAPPKYLSFRNHTVEGQNFVTLIIPGTPSFTNEPTGYVVVLYDAAKLETYLFQNDYSQNFTIHVLSPSGEQILGEPVFLSDDKLPTSIIKNLQVHHVEFDNRSWRVYTYPLQMYQWTMYFIIDKHAETSNIITFQNKITLYFFMLVALLFLVMVSGGIRTLKPFHKLASELKKRLGPEVIIPNHGEADSLRHGVELLFDSVEQMNRSLRQYYTMAKAVYIRQWLLQGSKLPIQASLSELSLLPNCATIQIVVIRIEAYKTFTEKFNFESRRLLKYGMGNIAEEILLNEGWQPEVVDMDGDHIVIVCGSKNEINNQIKFNSIIQKIKEVIKKWARINTVIAAGDLMAIDESIRGVYQNTYELTLLKFLTGEDKIFSNKDLEASLYTSYVFPDEQVLDELIIAVKQGNQLQMNDKLSNLMDNLKTLPYEELHFQLRMIVYVLFKSFNKVADWQKIMGSDKLVSQFASLNDFFDWLRDELSQIIDFLKDKLANNNRKEEITQEVKAYVQNHLHDPTLNIELIGEHLGLSASHIRHVFKEVNDETLSDYILNQRILKVKQLLITTNLPVLQISEMMGFQTKSHFYSTFKKMVGLTPNQFRTLEKQQ